MSPMRLAFLKYVTRLHSPEALFSKQITREMFSRRTVCVVFANLCCKEISITDTCHVLRTPA